jgi:hypothetical protein
MRVIIHAAIACSVALAPIGYAEAAKRMHRSHRVDVSHTTPGAPVSYFGNAAAEGNNANSMSGSNSAVENAVGRTNCC